MSEVAVHAQKAIAAHDGCATIRFSAALTPRKCASHPVKGFRWITTDCHAIVLFFLACWNSRHELASPHPIKQEDSMSEWQPIETAPKDGTEFLAWCDAWEGEIGGTDYRHFMAVTSGPPSKSDNSGECVWWAGDGDAYMVWLRAKYWMPLPAPPLSNE